ncbi:MAG TPA: acetate--CoA ligase [Phycisphaerae bacterium]|nr:acetate--CoA ligase [Phycisphaerae bacterium]HNU45895.1 acetate--CoA ligase [Phycisphaerae bacterium]
MPETTTAKDVFPPSAGFRDRAYIKSMEQYRQMYQESIDHPDQFWGKVGEEFYWKQRWTKVREFDFRDKISIKYYLGAKTNITYNCLDRHLEKHGNQVAIIWEGNEPGEDAKLTYKQLHAEVCKMANVLKKFGVKKGDRVSIYMPMLKELAIAMLACARIGAIHSIVFGGFSPDSLADRIVDSRCEILLTTDGVYRGAKAVTLKANADEAMRLAGKQGVNVKTCIVYERVGKGKLTTDMLAGRDHWWHDVMKDASPQCDCEWMDSEDPLFILYTSGSTGKPKGVLHTVGGYMVFVACTHKYIFDYHDGDIFWCTADIGWVTGHSYIVYGPLCNGATSVMFEGIPTYPNAGRFWDVVDKYKVTQFYTAPTAIRALMREGDDPPKQRSLASLRLLGTVGEPINPEAWMWYHRFIGHERCPIVDTWWQTETGGILITPLPGAVPAKPGSATLPFFGVKPCIIDEKGNIVQGPASGALFISEPWPGIMRTVYGQHERFKETYFTRVPGYYFTGDGCRRDEDGYYWITGRIDDVINVSGHRLGTAEVESALVSHPAVAEAAVVGYPHEIKGQGIYAYVTLRTGNEYTDALKKELVAHVRKEIGPIATPDVIHWAPGLPKTRSGKIMRRILRKIAEGQSDQIGDTTTLADPSVVDNLVKTYKK